MTSKVDRAVLKGVGLEMRSCPASPVVRFAKQDLEPAGAGCGDGGDRPVAASHPPEVARRKAAVHWFGGPKSAFDPSAIFDAAPSTPYAVV